MINYFDSTGLDLTDEQVKYRHYDEEGNEYFEVDKILDKKFDSRERKYKYKVMWKGWPREEDQTWEPYENLEHVRDIVDEFEKAWKEKPKKKTGRGAKATAHAVEEKTEVEEKPDQEPEKEAEKTTPVKEPVPIKETTKESKKGKETTIRAAKMMPTKPKTSKTKTSQASKVNSSPATNILKDKVGEQKGDSTANEPPLGEAYSVPIKKKTAKMDEEETIDPRIRKKDSTTPSKAAPIPDMRDNTSGFSFSTKPVQSSDEINLPKRPSQDSRAQQFSFGQTAARFSDFPVTNKPLASALGTPPKPSVMEISAPKMTLLESIVSKEQENNIAPFSSKPEPPNVFGNKPNPPEKELPSGLSRNKSIPDDSKHRPPAPSTHYNPYSPVPPISPVSTTDATSPFGQMFKQQGEMVVEEPQKQLGKPDRKKLIEDDIDKMMEEESPEEVSLTKMDSVRSDLLPPPQGISRHKSEPFDVKKQPLKKPSEIVIDDDDDDVDSGKKDQINSKGNVGSYGKKKERAHSKSRSRSRSPGHNKRKGKWNESSPEAKDRDKGKFKDRDRHYEGDKHHHGDDKYHKNKEKEKEKDREREREREKGRDREKEREKEKQKEKEKDRERDRHKKDAAQDRHNKVDHYAKKSHEVGSGEKSKRDKHDVEEVKEVKLQKKRVVYKKTLYAKESLRLDYDVDSGAHYKSIVNEYMEKKIDREVFLDMLCPEGNFKDDEIQEVKAMSWEGKVSTNPEDYYFKVVWKPNRDGVQKGCRYVSWQEFLEEKPKEAAEFVMNKLMTIMTKYGTFGEM